MSKQKFKGDENPIFYDKLFRRLQAEKKITKSEDKQFFVLTPEESERISSLVTQYDLDEREFLSGIISILKKYNQESELEKYIVHLKKVYTDNFNNDIIGIINNNSDLELKGISREFINFLSKNVEPLKAKPLALDLFHFCQGNNFIQKFCAGKVFSERTNLNKIETYINTQKKIFIDTQIVLYGLCYFDNPKSDYGNYFFQTSK